MIGWGRRANVVWGETAQSRLDVWGLAHQMYCICGQAEHLNGMKVIQVSIC